jgi:hypothetical protein
LLKRSHAHVSLRCSDRIRGDRLGRRLVAGGLTGCVILPPLFSLTPGSGRVLTFTSVTGLVSYNNDVGDPTFYGNNDGPAGHNGWSETGQT